MLPACKCVILLEVYKDYKLEGGWFGFCWVFSPQNITKQKTILSFSFFFFNYYIATAQVTKWAYVVKSTQKV